MTPRAKLAILATLAIAVLASSIFAALVFFETPASHPFRISIAIEGTPVVGREVMVTILVEALFGNGTPSARPVFLSLEVPPSLTIVEADQADEPWGLANVWNLTGLDFSTPRSFSMNATPEEAGEVQLWARAWSPRTSLSEVGIVPSGVVDPETVLFQGSASTSLITTWPFQVDLAVAGELTVGNTVEASATVQGNHSVAPPPNLVYVSVGMKPQRLEPESVDSGDDPWGLPNVWNATGLELSSPTQFTLGARVVSGGNLSALAAIWSPRRSWADVQINQSGIVGNSEAIRTWGSVTVALSVRQGSPGAYRISTGGSDEGPGLVPPNPVASLALRPQGVWVRGSAATIAVNISLLVDLSGAELLASLTGPGRLLEERLVLGALPAATRHSVPMLLIPGEFGLFEASVILVGEASGRGIREHRLALFEFSTEGVRLLPLRSGVSAYSLPAIQVSPSSGDPLGTEPLPPSPTSNATFRPLPPEFYNQTPTSKSNGSMATQSALPGPRPAAGTITVKGRFIYEPVVTDDLAGTWLPESPKHPYDNNVQAWQYRRSVVEYGATTVWVFFSRIEIESGFDHLYVKDRSGNIVWQSETAYLGRVEYTNLWVSVPGDTATVEFTSDGSVTYWGYNVAKYARDSTSYGTKWATVEIWDRDSIWGDHLLETLVTDSYGRFTSSALSNSDEWGTRDIYVRVGATSSAADVTHSVGCCLLAYDGFTSIYWDVADGTLDIGTWRVPPSENTAWFIYDTLMHGHDFMKYGPAGWQPPWVGTLWEPGVSRTTRYNQYTGEIEYDRLDGQSPDIVLHEYGHMVMHRGYDNWLPTSGGAHEWCGNYDAGLVWAEGWADFFFAPVQLYAGRGNYYFDYNTDPNPDRNMEIMGCGSGDTNEYAIAATLYDIYDSAVDGPDTYTGGFWRIWSVLRSGRHSSFSQYFSAWRTYHGTNAFHIHYAKVNAFQNTIDYDAWAPGASNLEPVTAATNGYYRGTVQVHGYVSDQDAEDAPYLDVWFDYWDGSAGVWRQFYDAGRGASGWRDGYWDTLNPRVPDGLYSIRVRVSDQMESSWIQRSNIIDLDNTLPTAPGKPTWTAGDESDGVYTLSWSSSSDARSGVWKYELQRQPSGGSWVTLSSSITGTSYTVSCTPPGTYYHRVRAQDRAGNWGPWSTTSDALTITTDNCGGGGGGGNCPPICPIAILPTLTTPGIPIEVFAAVLSVQAALLLVALGRRLRSRRRVPTTRIKGGPGP